MKTVIGIVVAIIIVAGGGYALVKHNNDKAKPVMQSAYSSSRPANNASNAGSPASQAKQPSQSSANSSSSPTASSVGISNFAFSPADITVKKGTAVTWTNKDSVAHTVAEMDGKDGPKSNDLNQNQTYSFTYNTVGTFKYHCSIHPNMTGTVTVTE